MRKTLALAALTAIAIGLVGCAGSPKNIGSVLSNVTNAPAITGTTSMNLDVAAFNLALTQMKQGITVTAVTPYGSLTGTRTGSTNITPLTAAQEAYVLANPIASGMYALRNDNAAQNVTWQGVGGTFTLQTFPQGGAGVTITATNTINAAIPVTTSLTLTPAK